MRGYDLVLCRDLFGAFILYRRWFGLNNHRGGVKQQVFDDRDDALRTIKRIRHAREKEALADGLRRQRTWHYPPEALREAIINALAHRDWTRALEVEIVAYADRLEILSPGALQNSMTIEKVLAGQRSPRNPIIVEVLRDYGYVDARGMGVRNKIVPLMREANGTELGFEATEDHVRVVLPKG
jgi:predicted HTH transcriptional regulator